MLFLSTKIVDNLWRTVLTFDKSDIFASLLSEMPFFYTAVYTNNINMLQLFVANMGGYGVKIILQ